MLQNENQNSQIEENVKEKENDEISLIDLFAVLWKRKKMIIGITVFSMIAIVIISIISLLLPPDKSFLPNEYTVYSTMLIKEDDGGAGIDLGGAAAMASMMGVSVPTGGSNTSSLVLYLIKSDLFLDAIVKEFDIVTKYEIEKYPIASIKLVEEYGSSDELSMRANNTSAFNYRIVENVDRLSWHAYGLAITDITTGKSYKAQPFPPFIQNIINSGGLLNSLKEGMSND